MKEKQEWRATPRLYAWATVWTGVLFAEKDKTRSPWAGLGEKVNNSISDKLSLRCLFEPRDVELAVGYLNLEFKERVWIGEKFEIHQNLGVTIALELEKIFQREGVDWEEKSLKKKDKL